MSDYGYFVIKSIAFYLLLGTLCAMFKTLVPLWALLLLPTWNNGVDD